MFDTVGARYVLRAVVSAALAGLGATATALVADSSIAAIDAVIIATAVLTSFGGYLGIGAASSSVEPNVGNKKT